MKKLITCAMIFMAATCYADDSARFQWHFAKKDKFTIKVHSIIDGDGRKESRFEAVLEVLEVPHKGPAKGKLTFKKVYAIKSLAGSGATAGEDQLEGKYVKCAIAKNGRLHPNPTDLQRLEDSLEDVLEDIDLHAHFKNLFFQLPEKRIKILSNWSQYQDNCPVSLKLDKIQKLGPNSIASVSGKAAAPTDSSIEQSGTITMRFDVTRGHMLEFHQYLTRKRTLGSIIKTTTTSTYKRDITIIRQIPPKAPKAAPAKPDKVEEKAKDKTEDGKVERAKPMPEAKNPKAKLPECPECKKPVPKDSQFCPRDGAKIEPPKAPKPKAPIKPSCPSCGKVYDKGSEFCPKDGTKLVSPKPE